MVTIDRCITLTSSNFMKTIKQINIFQHIYQKVEFAPFFLIWNSFSASTSAKFDVTSIPASANIKASSNSCFHGNLPYLSHAFLYAIISDGTQIDSSPRRRSDC